MSKSRFTPEYEILLRRLIGLRKAAGVTQKQVAAKLGKPQSHVSKCESQDREISITDLRKWCQALNIPVHELIQEWDETVK